MAFNAGAIVGTAKVDDSKWNSGMKGLTKSVGVFVAAVGTTAVAAMAKATKEADIWQKSLSNVNTLTDEATVNSQDMAKNLLALDSSLGDTTELTNAMYQSFSSGAATMDEAMSVTTDAAKFAKAALTDTSTAVDVLTTAQNAYGKATMSTEQASDIFFTTIKQGKINGEELSGVIGQSIPLFASMGVPLEELGAGMAAMTKQGVAASETTTQLNAIMNSFLSPSAAMSEALASQGYESGSALIEAEGLAGALEFLEETTGGSKEALTELLPNTRAVRGALALTGTGGEEFTKILDEMGNAAGATSEAFGEQELTFDTLKNAMNKVELVAGNIGKFFVDDIARGATIAAEGMLQFVMSGSMAEIVGNLVGGVAAGFELLQQYMAPVTDQFGPAFAEIATEISDGLTSLKSGQESSISGFDLLSTSSQFAASGFSIATVMVTGLIDNIFNLVGVIQQSAQTIGSVGDLLSGKASFSDVKQNASEAWEAIKEFGTGVVVNAKELYTTVGDEVVSFKDKVQTQAIEMESAVISSFTSQKTAVTTNWDEMITGQVSSFDGLISTVEAGNTEMTEKTVSLNDEMEKDSKSTIGKITDAWEKHFSEFSETASSAFDTAMSAGSSLMSGLSTIIDLETQNQLDAVTIQYQEEEAALEAKLDAGLISQDEYDTAIEEMEAEQLAKENEINKKAFETNKKMQIAEIWMDAAKSTASWWSTAGSLGPIAGPIFAGVMTGATIAMAAKQTSLVQQQQFVPAYEDGGMASGTIQMNEAGGEIVTLPDGSQVIPNDISQQIAANSGKQTSQTIVNFYGGMQIRNDQDINKLVNMIDKKLGKKSRVA